MIEKQFSLLENIASGINSNKDVNNKSSRKSWKKKLGNTLNSIKSFVGYLVGLPASSNSTELEVINEFNSNKILNDDIQSSVQTYVK